MIYKVIKTQGKISASTISGGRFSIYTWLLSLFGIRPQTTTTTTTTLVPITSTTTTTTTGTSTTSTTTVVPTTTSTTTLATTTTTTLAPTTTTTTLPITSTSTTTTLAPPTTTTTTLAPTTTSTTTIPTTTTTTTLVPTTTTTTLPVTSTTTTTLVPTTTTTTVVPTTSTTTSTTVVPTTSTTTTLAPTTSTTTTILPTTTTTTAVPTTTTTTLVPTSTTTTTTVTLSYTKIETSVGAAQGVPTYYPVAIFRPSGYVPGNTYPLILNFHGNGENGGGTSNINRLYLNGLPKAMNDGYVPSTDYIIVCPQDNWGSVDGANVPSILTWVKTLYNIDLNRIYITGYSGGGGTTVSATMGVSSAFLQNFAAVIPFSSSATPSNASWYIGSGVAGVWCVSGPNSGTEASGGYYGNTLNTANQINAQVPGLAKLTQAAGLGHGGSFLTLYNGTYNDAGVTFWSYIAGKVRSGITTTTTTSSTTSTTTIAGSTTTTTTVVGSNIMSDVATGEYSVKWVKNDGTVWTPFETVYNTTVVTQELTGLTGIVATDGGQYHSILLKNDGTVYDSRLNLKTSTAYTVDNLGNPFTADKVYAMWRQNLAIKNGEVYYWSADNGGTGEEDMLQQFGTLTTDVPAPRKLIQPVGKTITKLIHGSSISPYSGARLWGLASDGTLWQWSVSITTPVQVLGKAGFPGTTWTGTVVDAAMIGPSANIVVTSTNQVWAWGYGSHIIGGFDDWQNLTMTNITANLTSAGIVFPLKQLTANYLTAYVIDANDNMFAIGNNQIGTVGDGYMTPSWRTHYNGTNSHVYAFDFNMDHGAQFTWKQVPGKWSNIKTNTTFVFYTYGQDMDGNWYSWGRAKARVLGNGKTWGNIDQATYPDYLDIPAPRLVSPVTNLSWTLTPADGTLNPATARTPIANAGINQYLTGVTSTTLYGSGSHQQQPTNATTVTMTNNWTRISGPNTPTITNPTSQNTTVTGMINGTYVFRNTVTNSVGATDYQEVTVVIT